MGNTQLVRAAGLLLDNDGVLVDSTAAVEESWRAFAGWYDLPIDAVLERVHGRRSRDVITYYADRLPVSADEAFAGTSTLAYVTSPRSTFSPEPRILSPPSPSGDGPLSPPVPRS
jgi:hypothetical protein